jgi:hypothetical protein
MSPLEQVLLNDKKDTYRNMAEREVMFQAFDVYNSNKLVYQKIKNYKKYDTLFCEARFR